MDTNINVPVLNLDSAVDEFVSDPSQTYFKIDWTLLYEAIADETVPLPENFIWNRETTVNVFKMIRSYNVVDPED